LELSIAGDVVVPLDVRDGPVHIVLGHLDAQALALLKHDQLINHGLKGAGALGLHLLLESILVRGTPTHLALQPLDTLRHLAESDRLAIDLGDDAVEQYRVRRRRSGPRAGQNQPEQKYTEFGVETHCFMVS
jgi:hypothetical protein